MTSDERAMMRDELDAVADDAYWGIRVDELRELLQAREETKRALAEAQERLRVLGLRLCSQCGQRHEASACGPTHALIAHERAESCPSLVDADRRASEAEARATNLHEALLSVKRRTVADGLPCWCEQFTERRGDVAYSGVHGPICKAAREALAAKEPTT